MGLKEIIQNHPVIVYTTAIIIGFVAGWNIQGYYLKVSGDYISADKVREAYVLKEDCPQKSQIAEETKDYCKAVQQLRADATSIVDHSLTTVKDDKRKKVVYQTAKEEIDYTISSNNKNCRSMQATEFSELKSKVNLVLSKNGLNGLY